MFLKLVRQAFQKNSGKKINVSLDFLAKRNTLIKCYFLITIGVKNWGKKMSLSTLKNKGQITLPAVVRKQLHADKGDIFNFEVVEGKVIMTLHKLVPARHREASNKKRDLSKWIGSAPGVFSSVQAVDEFIRKERDAWD